ESSARGAHQGPDHLDPRPEGRRATALPATCRERRHTPLSCLRGDLVEQPCLADARLTDDDEQTAPPRLRGVEARPQLAQLPLRPNQDAESDLIAGRHDQTAARPTGAMFRTAVMWTRLVVCIDSS